jgi:hypothetical protein
MYTSCFSWGAVLINDRQMVTALEQMMFERLSLYLKRNRQLPGRIIVFRDGVSEVCIYSSGFGNHEAEFCSLSRDNMRSYSKKSYPKSSILSSVSVIIDLL